MIIAFRKITASLVLFTAMLPLLLPLAMRVKERLIHFQMQRRLEREAVHHTLVLKESDVAWMDEHEIRVNEKMFDISSMKLANGVYTFTGLYDEEETLLLQQEKERSGSNAAETRELSRLFETLSHLFCNTTDPVKRDSDSAIKYTSDTLHHLTHPFFPILTPPPQAPFTIS